MITITLDGISEYKEPKPYEHFPSVRVDVYVGSNLNDANRYYHRCAPVRGLSAVDNEKEAIKLANTWLDVKVNRDKVVTEIISAIGE